MELHIGKWGNSLAVRIPAEVVRQIGLKEGETVQAKVTADGALIICHEQWKRGAFAAELAQAREGMKMGSSVMETLRAEARY